MLGTSNEESGETVINNYGDFKFDGLPQSGGRCKLEIEYPG